jgi:hypothetical protein
MHSYYRLHTDVTPPPACKHRELSLFLGNYHSAFSVLCLYLKDYHAQRDKKATEDYGVPGYVLGEGSF